LSEKGGLFKGPFKRLLANFRRLMAFLLKLVVFIKVMTGSGELITIASVLLLEEGTAVLDCSSTNSNERGEGVIKSTVSA